MAVTVPPPALWQPVSGQPQRAKGRLRLDFQRALRLFGCQIQPEEPGQPRSLTPAGRVRLHAVAARLGTLGQLTLGKGRHNIEYRNIVTAIVFCRENSSESGVLVLAT